MLKEEKRVQKFLEKTEDHFNKDEFLIILEGYDCLRQVVGPDMYSEVVQELETSVLTRRSENDDITLDAVINDAVNNLKLSKLVDTSIVDIKEVNESDVAYDKTESTRRNAVSKVYESLKCSKSLQNQVFLDVLSGIDRNTIARKYRLTRADVDSIYDERLGFVKNILIINDDILIEDVESRTIESNARKVTESKK